MARYWFSLILVLAIFYICRSDVSEVEVNSIGEQVNFGTNHHIDVEEEKPKAIDESTSSLLQSGYDVFIKAQLGDRDALQAMQHAARSTANNLGAMYGDDDVALTETSYLMLLYGSGSATVAKNLTTAKDLAEQVSPFLQRQQRSLSETDADYPFLSLLLAILHTEGWGFVATNNNPQAENDELAIKYLRIAAEAGIPAAQTSLAASYFEGKRVERDIDIAAQWYRRAAESGDAYGELFYGLCFYFGHGVEKNMQEAFQWFLKAANSGFSEGEYLVGHCYSTGQGVGSVDMEQAVHWYERAAMHGQREAQFKLGYFYNVGMGGKKRDLGEAQHWYKLAASQGHPDAGFFLPAAVAIDHMAGIWESVIYPLIEPIYPNLEFLYSYFFS